MHGLADEETFVPAEDDPYSSGKDDGGLTDSMPLPIRAGRSAPFPPRPVILGFFSCLFHLEES